MRLLGLTCIGFSLLLAALPAQAQWKWKDSKGTIVVSDIPPPRDVPERDVLQKPEFVARRPAPAAVATANPASAVPTDKPKVDPELEARRKRSEQEQADRHKADEVKVAAARADNCKRAREHLASLESGARLARTSESGEREIMDDKARADEMQRTRQIISSECR
jgi:Domain of unknown function (DUF4124)